jgi:hypothetical protein
MSRAAHAFLNIPYDDRYQLLYVAFVAGLSGFGLVPHATLELPGPQRRLDRIAQLIEHCQYSFHDLSRVQTSGPTPRVPRFNMPFELGLAVERGRRRKHQWFVFEEEQHRLQRSLSDLNGTDPYIHHGDADQLLVQLSNALVRRAQPPLARLRVIHEVVRRAARTIRHEYGTLYDARPFEELVVAATRAAADAA